MCIDSIVISVFNRAAELLEVDVVEVVPFLDPGAVRERRSFEQAPRERDAAVALDALQQVEPHGPFPCLCCVLWFVVVDHCHAYC